MSRLGADQHDARRTVGELAGEVAAIQAKLGLVGDLDLMGQTHTFKCKGTFVGHQGPVWALTAYGDYLFSGSSDETIKVRAAPGAAPARAVVDAPRAGRSGTRSATSSASARSTRTAASCTPLSAPSAAAAPPAARAGAGGGPRDVTAAPPAAQAQAL